ncbi:Glucan endo-1 3-beta-glucosidase-like [Thalictrum thalictroides]|uniref:Glucan endo-1 3-beta-glucosidase-like n=1 Tax=Thalictrum thalictroides TaxID=46969 RepID=A0A7J6WAH1_THATH|nr:Glucan endo-1 3-beta-glucosidase-like [Thalictrum thalictroides]
MTTINYQLLALASFVVLIGLGSKLADGSSIGVCYENQDENLPPAHVIVSMYLTNHIGRMRLYEPNFAMFDALRGTGIQVSVNIDDGYIEQIAYSEEAANEWVQTYIRPYWPDVHFRYIIVGNEVIPSNYAQFVLPAMQNLHNALGYGGLWSTIKVTTTVSPSVMAVSFPPSAGQFSQSAAEYLEPIAQYLHSTGAPLLANVYPYVDFMQNPEQIPLTYALFTANNYVFTDYGLEYQNSFDATIDALYSSLEKVGAPKIRIVVSETGWPSSDDNNVATIYTAQLYNSNLIRHVLSSQGTPKRPGKQIETYLFSLFDERRNFGGTTESHFGLFNHADMRPMYPINFQGSG